MPDLLVRNLSDATLSGLKAIAKRKRRSTQAEVAEILEQTVAADEQSLRFWAAVDRVKQELAGKILPDSSEIIRADRER